jgi:hypothetical protein
LLSLSLIAYEVDGHYYAILVGFNEPHSPDVEVRQNVTGTGTINDESALTGLGVVSAGNAEEHNRSSGPGASWPLAR